MAKSVFIKDAQQSDDIIVANYPWARHIASQFFTGTPFDDEIHGAAILGLVKAGNKLKAGHKPTGTDISYIRNYVTGEIMEVIRKRRLINIPNTTLRRRRERGDSTAITVLYETTLDDWNDVVDEKGSIIHKNAMVNPESVDTTSDFLKELQFTESEISVLELRLEGKTMREVAESLTIEKSMVSLLVKAMRRRWKKWLRGER